MQTRVNQQSHRVSRKTEMNLEVPAPLVLRLVSVLHCVDNGGRLAHEPQNQIHLLQQSRWQLVGGVGFPAGLPVMNADQPWLTQFASIQLPLDELARRQQSLGIRGNQRSMPR